MTFVHRKQKPSRVGVVGIGDISAHYLDNAASFTSFTVTAVADLDVERAQAVGEQRGLRALSPDELLRDPDVDVVLNLTPPAVHFRVTTQALERGKHVYSEKPLATTVADAHALAALAHARGLKVCCAPDTFMGPAWDAARTLLADGAIGRPFAVFMAPVDEPPERWHPNPEFLYQPGAGPAFDMGPYHLRVLVSLFGRVRTIRASATTGHPIRTVATGSLAGSTFAARTPSHISALLETADGVHATLLASFDVLAHHLPKFEVYGTSGSLSLPDPNNFVGEVLVGNEAGWAPAVTRAEGQGDCRGAGLADMIDAAHEDREPLASLDVAVHLVEVMEAMLEAARTGASVTIDPKDGPDPD